MKSRFFALLAATVFAILCDPVIRSGEMIAEYHRHYASAALMLVNEAHEKVAKKSF